MTIEAWFDALRDKGLTDDDVPRVHAAFRHLAASRDTWPAPINLIDALTDLPRRYFHALPKPEQTPEEIEAERVRRRAMVDAAAEQLRMRSYRDEP